MEKEVQDFLKAEETALNLVETLKQLHTEATSYITARKELDVVRQKLSTMIESTEKLASGSHEVVRILKEIGGPEILSKLTKLEDKSDTEFTKQSRSFDRLKTLILITLTGSIIAIIIGIIALLK
ncbi:MAG: hypothetical protein OEW70_04825 [candidate division WOR-3 bacterium]|nr:hypothetical protein [candidate division WOR-3 bacterium]